MVLSPFASLDVPDVSFPSYVLDHIKAHDQRLPCLVDGVTGESYTYGEVRAAVVNIASSLWRRGVRRGDVIAIYSPNSPKWAMFYFGVLASGATVTTINPAYTPREVEAHLKDSGAKRIFSNSKLLANIRQITSYVGFKDVFCADGTDSRYTSVSDLVADDGSCFPVPCPSKGHDVAVLLYSSGTTGLPKGVMITHKNLLASSIQLRHPKLTNQILCKKGIQTTSLLMLPLFHVYGMVGILTWSLIGGHRIISLPEFIPSAFLRTIQDYRINVAPLVPPLVVFLAKSPLVNQYDLSSLEEVHIGAAPLSKETEEEFKNRTGVNFVRQCYGMTELTSAVTFVPFEVQHKFGSIGPPMPGSEIIIIDINTGKKLGSKERGEVLVRGDQVMKGYLNRQEVTKDSIDSKGFMHTGDIGYYDDDGYFYIVDRLKELIKVKGFQVAPAELEAVLLTHPGVADAAVVGVPDEKAGELPRGLVVTKPGVVITEKEILTYVADRLADFKRLAGGVEFVSIVPKTPSGKILRRELNNRYKSKI